MNPLMNGVFAHALSSGDLPDRRFAGKGELPVRAGNLVVELS